MQGTVVRQGVVSTGTGEDEGQGGRGSLHDMAKVDQALLGTRHVGSPILAQGAEELCKLHAKVLQRDETGPSQASRQDPAKPSTSAPMAASRGLPGWSRAHLSWFTTANHSLERISFSSTARWSYDAGAWMPSWYDTLTAR